MAEGINSTIRAATCRATPRRAPSRRRKRRLAGRNFAAVRSIPISSRARCAPIAFARPGSAEWSMPSPRRSWAACRNGISCATTAWPTAYRRFLAPVPEVVSGVLLKEAQQAWRDWSPFAWEMIKLRGLLTAPCAAGGSYPGAARAQPVPVALPANPLHAKRSISNANRGRRRAARRFVSRPSRPRSIQPWISCLQLPAARSKLAGLERPSPAEPGRKGRSAASCAVRSTSLPII